MQFTDKHKLALDELATTGMKTRICLPPIHRLLWRFSVNIRPPHYSTFVDIVIGIATAFTILWGSIMTLVTGTDSLLENFTLSAGIGFILGLFMAFYYRHGSRKFNLSGWEELGTSEQVFRDRND